MPKQIIIEDENNVVIDFVYEDVVDLKVDNAYFVGTDVSNANAEEDSVARGQTFYAKDNGVLKIGTLDAYSVVQTLLPNNKCRIEVKTLGKPESDLIVTERNISLYKIQDRQRVIREGGELASDEEYVEAEKYLQELYKRIMGVEEDG